MHKGFVFGKFLPFHMGHKAMIQFALTRCDFLTVLVCCSDKEIINGETRSNWIKASFPNEQKLDIRIFNYNESELINTSESSRQVSKEWAKVFKRLLPQHKLLITSEPYGDFVAEFMSIEHISYDNQRILHPVSSSQIRKNIFLTWKFLPSKVKSFYATKVIILGSESTGKTTLSQQLATYFNCEYVAEAGRDLISNSQSFSLNDLNLVAAEHARRIQESVEKSPLVIIDTDIHITKSYSLFSFGKDLTYSNELYKTNMGDLYLYLTCDVPFVQDGTRMDEQNRHKLDISHRQVLKDHNIDFVEIGGDWNSRFDQAVKHIKELIEE
jgi:HTH-type transcriptional repressor of NAD biosynthesis genes